MKSYLVSEAVLYPLKMIQYLERLENIFLYIYLKGIMNLLEQEKQDKEEEGKKDKEEGKKDKEQNKKFKNKLFLK